MPEADRTTIAIRCRGTGWTLLYKKSTGVGGSPVETWSNAPRNERHPELLDRRKATLDYANSLIAHAWSHFTAARVEVGVGGASVRALRFNSHCFAVPRFHAAESVPADLPNRDVSPLGMHR